MNLFKTEPAVLIAAITAVLGVLSVFLPSMTPERVAAINAALIAIAGVVIRSQVSPSS